MLTGEEDCFIHKEYSKNGNYTANNLKDYFTAFRITMTTQNQSKELFSIIQIL